MIVCLSTNKTSCVFGLFIFSYFRHCTGHYVNVKFHISNIGAVSAAAELYDFDDEKVETV